jgi:hypothetical protein
VLTVNHAYFTIERLVLEGQYGTDDLVRVATAGHGFTVRNSELAHTSRDAIDMNGPEDVLIEDSLIHHALNPANGLSDAHGVAAGPVRRLTIRNTEIHTFSGDGVQVDPGRSILGWSDVLVEGCRIWLEPLAEPLNGFPAGQTPGENAVDTKVNSSAPRATLTVRDTVVWGYRNGRIANLAGFNLHEKIDAVIDRVTVYDSEIGFRVRGPVGDIAGAFVRIQNAVVHDVSFGVRYENDIERLQVWNTTMGGGVGRAFYPAESGAGGLDVRNVLVLGSSLPAEASGASNRAVSAASFVDAPAHNYQLAAGSPAIDAGVTIPEVTRDRAGTTRPEGQAYDIGAYERSGSGSPSNFSITPSPTTVAPGGTLSLSWTAPPGRPSTDWIALYNVGAPNTSYLWWQYTSGATSGSVTLTGPAQADSYEFRYLLEGGYSVAAQSATVIVTSGGGGGGGGGSFSLTPNPATVAPGGTLNVSWTAPAGRPGSDWIALYRQGQPSQSYLWWQYTQGAASGSASLNAPAQPGQYEFRYLLENGYTQAAVSAPVSVGSGDPGGSTYSLTVDPVNVGVNGALSVSWTAPAGRPSGDWIGLYRIGDPSTSYLAWFYTSGTTSGNAPVAAPSQPGQYEFRYFLNDSYTEGARSAPITVALLQER